MLKNEAFVDLFTSGGNYAETGELGFPASERTGKEVCLGRNAPGTQGRKVQIILADATSRSNFLLYNPAQHYSLHLTDG